MSTMPVPTGEPLVDLDRARGLMREGGLDAIVACSFRNVFYLSGFASFDYLIEPESTAFAVLPARREAPACVTVSMSERYVLDEFPAWPPRKLFYGSYYIKGAPERGTAFPNAFEALCSALRDCGVIEGRVGFELDLLPVNLHRRIAERFPHLRIADASLVFCRLRAVKTAEEISRVRTVTGITERAIADAFARIHAGTPEKQIAYWISDGLLREGAEPVYVQLGTNGRGGLGISYPTARAVREGDVVRTDVAARYGQYHADLGRCCVVGEPTKEQRAYYQIARDALRAAVDAAAAGRPIKDVFAAAMRVPRNAGHTDFQRHHVGHGIGLQAHEWPFLRGESAEVLTPGMVLAIEVPYYIYGLGGFSPEDILVVRERDVELFSQAPDQLPIVG
jgi:Xaa-Pro aminopeptidase